MKKKSYLINLTLLFLSLLISFIIAEIGLRVHIFNRLPLLNKIPVIAKQRDPGLYTRPDSEDDYWKLWMRSKEFGDPRFRPAKPHPVLGWIGDFSKDDFIHNKTNYVGNRRPVLFYGDSFTGCVRQERCFQDFLNNDTEFSKNNFLLNYGVGGYGVDQIYILIKNSVDLYRNPFVIIGIYTKDLDRNIMSFEGAMKPHFRVENDTLKLDEKPLTLDPADFVRQYPPEINSYLYRRIMFSKFMKKLIPEKLFTYITRSDYYQRKKILVSEKILLALINEIRTRNLDFIFIIFEQYNPRKSTNHDIGWRVSFLKDFFEKNNLKYIWTREVINKNTRETDFSYNDYFIRNDGHPTAYLNGLISQEMKKHILIQ